MLLCLASKGKEPQYEITAHGDIPAILLQEQKRLLPKAFGLTVYAFVVLTFLQ